ncbi:SixA phosphatase family protein [Georgenia wangjunii]|uniref:SixA phosphatase family protein n=1 Tax=Georgenia wangjunii TaxID=3117730 RepID=UPI002F267BE8
MAPRTLVLLRHARAEPEGDLGDAMRPLAAAGRRQAAAIGPLIQEATGGVDLVLVSHALRTSETYKILAPALDPAPEVRVSAELYGAGPRALLGLLAEVGPEVRSVLVVGHEPTMSSLAHLLDGADEPVADRVSFGIGTATGAVLEVPVRWDELDRSSARLVALVEPPQG